MKKYTDTELLSKWEEKKSNGVTMRQWASEFEIPRETLHTWLKRAKKRVDNKQTEQKTIDTEQVKKTQNGNNLEIESNSRRINTLESLIRACDIDLEKWQIERHVINKWEVGAKDALGNIVIEPLFQVKAWLRPRKLESIELTVNPIKLQVTFHKRNIENTKRDFKTELVLPDMQFGFKRDLRTGRLDPFHDRLALDIACQIMHDLKPDGITLLGDILDLAEWTDKFIRTPEFYWTTQPAIIELGWWLSQILYEGTTSAKVKAIEGNHEQRIRDTLSIHLSTAYQLSSGIDTPPALSIPGLLDFKTLGIEWIDGYPDNAVWLKDDLKLIHGNIVSNEPGLTAKNVVMKSSVSTVFAHIHRAESATRTIYTQSRAKTITAVSPGCLCRIDGVVPGHNKNQNWQQGIAIIEYNDSYHSIHTIPIENGTAIYNGKVYTGLNRIEEIKLQTGWTF